MIQTRRHLPHIEVPGGVYHLTFRLVAGVLVPVEIIMARDHIRNGNTKFYQLYAVQVMPDHVHVLLQPLNGFSLPRILKGIKGVSARLINKQRGSLGSVWQQETFDRIIRSQSDFDEKLNYMYYNPVKSGIIASPEEYQGWFLQE